ncbi:hypothetical protein A6O24_10000 [Acidithiobacillus thiooxidans]|uniref:MobA/MobL family protein n=1 Tax=Acidithiobacillus thiooxidans TaxID=930 RepID=UPI00082566BA|nr:MobA/MobL family protein [Acidithiobacillus thiooxidans]OCX75354.1 hypothetical protein A6O24_10000 [Acidithiobacillus thiooxidans]
MAEYHLHAKTHSRGAGKGAGGHVRYILRQGPYAEKKVEQVDGSAMTKTRVSRADEVLHSESGNMPAWVQDPADYWDAADQYERANGSVYREIEFALPKELPDAVNILLAQDFAQRLATVPEGVTPYTLAIHHSEKDPSLLHCHLMLSDKVNDGIDRDATLWFKRAAASRTPTQKGKDKKPVDPARGGAPKTQARIGQDWLGAVVRPLWAELANQELAHAGYASIRIDHRSLEVQRQEAEQQAARLWEQGDHDAHRAALERVIALDRPPQPKRGRVLTHAGAEKAPDRAAMVLGYEAHKQARQAAAQAAAQAHREALALEKALQDAEQVLERARLRHGYRRDSWEIRERWAFRQQERARRREEERLLEEQAQREREEQALDDRVAAETAPGVRYPQRSRWREWRAQTLSRKYDPVYSAEMAKRDIYCRWMPEHGGLYLRLGKQEVIDQGPLLLAKNGALDIPLLIETAQGKGWETLTFTGPAEFQEKAAIAALQAGLAVADADLAQRAQAVIDAQREQERIEAAQRAGIPDAVGLAKKVSSEDGRNLCALIEKHETLEATADALAALGFDSKAIAVGVTYLVNERYRGQTKDRQQLTNEAAAQIGREAVFRHQQQPEVLFAGPEPTVQAENHPDQNKGHGLED